MIDGVEAYKRQQRRIALGGLGIAGTSERIFAGQARTADLASIQQSLPVDTDAYRPLQNEDGSFRFLFGYSAFGVDPF